MSFTYIAIGSAFFGAIANLMARMILKDINSQNIFWFNFVMMAGTMVFLAPLFYFSEATNLAMGILILIALIDTVANLSYFKTFEQLEAGSATPLLSLAPIVTFLLGFILLGDTASMQTLILSLGIMGGGSLLFFG